MSDQEKIFLNSVFFVIGFVLVFSTIGILLQTFLSHISFQAMEIIRVAGGIIILSFGILLIASARYIVPFFSTEHKLHFRRLDNRYLSSLLFGVGFALGWTPCVGAILGAIYALAVSQPGIGFLLLLAYSLGLGIPFLVFGVFISKLSGFMKRVGPALRYFNIVGGLLLIGMGLLVITGYIGELAVFLVGAAGTMSFSEQLNFLFAIVAGLLTFISPCILPLLPAYLSYMTGTSAQEASA
ncbi:MAG TPA: cytochrome c biogenesis protein CcdA [Candidatus Acidoferrum sp.]|nr:cytochrome c biogenesis protein CcdA [Candidatus Acidoferrum sp.]